jgi:hypothetical protein
VSGVCVVVVWLPVGPLLGVDAGVGVVVGHGTRELDHVGGDAVVRGGGRGGHGGATGGRRGGRRREVIIHCHHTRAAEGEVSMQSHMGQAGHRGALWVEWAWGVVEEPDMGMMA